MTGAARPKNRRLPAAPRKAGGVVDAPADPIPQIDESPAPPPATTTTLRPPGRRRPSAPPPLRSRVARWLQLTVGVTVVLACSIAVAWGARRYITSSPRFAVRSVLVEGTSRRTADQVAKAGGVAVGKNIFALDLDLARESILTDPWIVSATVTRKLPSAVHIAIVEREARALVVIGGELYLATSEGDLFKKVAEEDPYDLPVITGVTPESVAADRAGASLTVKRAIDVVTDLERSGVAKRYPIQELHLEKDGALVVIIGRDAIAMHLGHAPFRGKIEQASRVLAEVAYRKATPSVIFLDNDAHPERVVVRMR
jgi:cell division protein FtsQ